MTWIESAAQQYASEQGKSKPSKRDIEAATELFNRTNARRLAAGLKPFKN